MKVLNVVPQGRVLDSLPTDCNDIVAWAKRCVDEVISEMSEYFSDEEVAEAAEALHDMLKRWQGRRTGK